VDRSVDVLAFAAGIPVKKSGHDTHVGVVAADVPGVAAAGGDGRRVGDIVGVVSRRCHLTAGRQVGQIAGEIVAPRSRLPEWRQ